MKNKIIFLLISTVIIFVLVARHTMLVRYPVRQEFTQTTKPVKQENPIKNPITVYQKITLPANKGNDFKLISVEKGKTAFDLLMQTQTVQKSGEGVNIFVVGINGVNTSPKEKTYWAFYVNGKQAPVGAGSYLLKNGDLIEWKLETY